MTETSSPANLPQSLLRGLLGGLLGAVLGHILVTLCLHAGGELWLKGPYGPHFFGISLYIGALYGSIAYSLSRRKNPTLVGGLGAFLGIALPMAILTRVAHWGMATNSPPTLAWVWAVLIIHTVATWGVTLALGAVLCPARPVRGALLATVGSLAGYLLLNAWLWLVPSYAQGRWVPTSFIPSPVDMLTGLLIGAGIGGGIYLAARKNDVQT
ncbi:MAG: hypothetical protein WC881_09605 [Elusimicrobiota bacterium]|jgi:hypothetical protein